MLKIDECLDWVGGYDLICQVGFRDQSFGKRSKTGNKEIVSADKKKKVHL